MNGDPESSRSEQILRAAAKLFAQRGYTATTMNAIGEQIGTSGPAIYSHFESKEAILIALVRELDQSLADPVNDEAVEDPLETLRSMARLHVAGLFAHRDVGVVVARDARDLPVEASRLIEARRSVYLDRWTRLLARLMPGLSGEELAIRVNGGLGIANFAAVSSIADRSEVPAPDVMAEMTVAAMTAPDQTSAPVARS